MWNSGRTPASTLETTPAHLPRDQGLPEGWRCIQKLHKTGKSAGKCYIRFRSPWGDENVQSIPDAIRVDASKRGFDWARLGAVALCTNIIKPMFNDAEMSSMALAQA